MELQDSAEYSSSNKKSKLPTTAESELSLSLSPSHQHHHVVSSSSSSSSSSIKSSYSSSSSSSKSSMSSNSSTWRDLYRRSLKFQETTVVNDEKSKQNKPAPARQGQQKQKITIHIKLIGFSSSSEVTATTTTTTTTIVTGRFHPIETTIGEIKEKLSNKLGISSTNQQTLHLMMVMMKETNPPTKVALNDDAITLRDANIMNGHTLELHTK